MVAAAGPAVGSLWWLLKGGGHLLSKPWARTGLTLGTGAAFIPGMQESIKKGIVDTPLDFETLKGEAKHTLNPLQRLLLGDLRGDSEDALTTRSKRKQSKELKDLYPQIYEIEGKLNKKFDITKDDPLAFISANRKALKELNLAEELNTAKSRRQDVYTSQGAVDQRNIERRARELDRQQTIWQNQQAEAQFNALLAKEKALELARIDERRDSNRLLQMQLNNDQARHMYGLETQRLADKGKKTTAVFDSLGALAGLFGI